MKKIVSVILAVLACYTLSAQTDSIQRYVIIKVQDTSTADLTQIQSMPDWQVIVDGYGVDTVYRPFENLGTPMDKYYKVRLEDAADILAMMQECKKLGYVEYVELEPLREIFVQPNDVDPRQYYLNVIRAAEAWAIATGSRDVVVGIIDNAIRLDHEDLKDNLWVNTGEIPGNRIDDDLNGYIDDVNGADVSDRDGNPNPPFPVGLQSAWNHGTHVAGIAAATTNNDKGIASISFNIRIMAVKCSPSSSDGNTLNSTLEGINYAVMNGADIINLSFGSEGTSRTGQALINAAELRNVVVVAAAGNENTSSLYYPCAYSGVVCVSATDPLDRKASFSNYGTHVDISAPGTNIFSTLATSANAYGNLSGTSMASPLVAGLAGLILSNDPTLTAEEVEALLEDFSDNIDSRNPSFDGQLGSGRINAAKALGTSSGLLPSPSVPGKLIVYPNPVRDELQLKMPVSQAQVYITDISGRVVSQSVLPVSAQRIDVSSLSPGVYTVEIRSGEQVWQAKVVKM